jgi:hypothetical protein
VWPAGRSENCWSRRAEGWRRLSGGNAVHPLGDQPVANSNVMGNDIDRAPLAGVTGKPLHVRTGSRPGQVPVNPHDA